MKHLKLLNYCKRMIKSTSAFGNANKGFASNELAQSDKSVKDQAVKMSLMLVSGALVWANGGLIEEAKAQDAWQRQESINQQNQYEADQEYYRQQQEAEARRQQERAEYNRQHPLGEPYVPAPKQKPSSYGAVAWDLKKGYVGTASQQASKQAAIDMAMQRCGTDNCEIIREYANQCMAIVYGAQLKGSKSKSFLRAGLTKNTAEKNALAACHKGARDCKIFVSECSLP